MGNSSADEGDTINDPSTLNSLYASDSFTIESEGLSVEHPHAYDLSKYLNHHRQNEAASNDDAATKDESTVRDDHGNKVPENAKMILGYDNVKRRTTSMVHRDHMIQDFPTVKKTESPDEMERRLRELAGQLSADWKGSSMMPPALARRLRDFQFAREKRRK